MKSTDEIAKLEILLKGTREKLELLRAGDILGTHFGIIYHDLQRHEGIFRQRLTALQAQSTQAASTAPKLTENQ